MLASVTIMDFCVFQADNQQMCAVHWALNGTVWWKNYKSEKHTTTTNQPHAIQCALFLLQ